MPAFDRQYQIFCRERYTRAPRYVVSKSGSSASGLLKKCKPVLAGIFERDADDRPAAAGNRIMNMRDDRSIGPKNKRCPDIRMGRESGHHVALKRTIVADMAATI